MSEHVYFTTIGLFLGTVLLIFGMRAVSTALHARAKLTGELGYRQLAETTAASQSATAAAVARIEQALADLSPRVAAVEKLLKDVG